MDDDELERKEREAFLSYARMLVKYWANVEDRDIEGKISGAIFSLLAAIDGAAPEVSRFDLISEKDIWINRNCDLHGLFYIEDETK